MEKRRHSLHPNLCLLEFRQHNTDKHAPNSIKIQPDCKITANQILANLSDLYKIRTCRHKANKAIKRKRKRKFVVKKKALSPLRNLTENSDPYTKYFAS